jgi:hypothetical protein
LAEVIKEHTAYLIEVEDEDELAECRSSSRGALPGDVGRMNEPCQATHNPAEQAFDPTG